MVEAPMRGVSPIVNEGPVGPNFRLEKTMTITIDKFKPVGEIRFNPKQAPQRAVIPHVFVDAFTPPSATVTEDSDTEIKRIWDEIRKQPDLTESLLSRALLAKEAMDRISTKPTINLGINPNVFRPEAPSSKPETKAGGFGYRLEEVKQAEGDIFENNRKHRPQIQEEEVEVESEKFILDQKAQQKRVNFVIEAVGKAKEAASKVHQKISGPWVGKYLVELFSKRKNEVESEATRGKGSDGSISELEQAINSYGEFESDQEAERISLKETYGKPPIRIRQDGERVSSEDIERVYREHQVKPNVLNIFRKRLLKKGSSPATEVVGLEMERRIEDDPDLAEVFNLAA